MINRLLAITLLVLATMSVFAAEQLPARPLVGTFQLYSSTPSLSGVNPRDMRSEIFQTRQQVRFEYVGEYGSDWPEREVYRISMLPPFVKNICLQRNWSFACASHDGRRLAKPPVHAISHDGYLDIFCLKTNEDIDLYKQFVPYGLKLGDFIYVMTYTDSRAAYVFYLEDRNTIVSQSAYNTQSKNDIVFVDQVLKRVKKR